MRPSGPDSATLFFEDSCVLAAVDVLDSGSWREALESIVEAREGPGLDVGLMVEMRCASSSFFFLRAASFLNYAMTSVREQPQSRHCGPSGRGKRGPRQLTMLRKGPGRVVS